MKILSSGLSSIQNKNSDHAWVKQRHLHEASRRYLMVNTRWKDTANLSIGDFVLMHRDNIMYQGKVKYEFLGSYEVVGLLLDVLITNYKYDLTSSQAGSWH